MKRIHALFLAAAVAACGDASDTVANVAPTERDSAGVRIVENPALLPGSTAQWRVDTVPAVVVGVADGDPSQEFGSIGGVAQLNGGMIAVLDGRGETAFEFRIFDSTGKHIATHGKYGQGPGEYQWVNFFGSTTGDTIVAVDFPSRRLNYLTTSKGYVRSIPLDEMALQQVIGGDGSGLVESMVPLDDSVYAIAAFHRRHAGAMLERSRSYQIVDMRARRSEQLTQMDEPTGRPLPALAAKRVSVFPVEPREPMHVIDRQRKRMCAASSHIPEITCLDNNGKRMIVRWHADSVPFTADDRSQYVERLRNNMSRYLSTSEIDAYVGALEFPAYFNPFSVLRIDAAGNFWVMERASIPNGHAQRFRIFDPDGRQIAYANHFSARPVGLGSREFFGSAAILRIFEDTDGVQKVGVFPVRR